MVKTSVAGVAVKLVPVTPSVLVAVPLVVVTTAGAAKILRIMPTAAVVLVPTPPGVLSVSGNPSGVPSMILMMGESPIEKEKGTVRAAVNLVSLVSLVPATVSVIVLIPVAVSLSVPCVPVGPSVVVKTAVAFVLTSVLVEVVLIPVAVYVPFPGATGGKVACAAGILRCQPQVVKLVLGAYTSLSTHPGSQVHKEKTQRRTHA